MNSPTGRTGLRSRLAASSASSGLTKDRTSTAPSDIAAIVEARHGDPFAVLGMHETGGDVVVRVFLPWARRVEVIDARSGDAVATLPKLHEAGFFAGPIAGR